VSKLEGWAAVVGSVAAVLTVGAAIPLAAHGLAASAASHRDGGSLLAPGRADAACTAHDIRVADGGTGVYDDVVEYQLRVFNAGHAPCDVAAEPKLTGQDNSGRNVTIRYAREAVPGGAISLAPGRYAYSKLSTPGTCAGIRPQARKRILVSLGTHLPGGGFVADARWLTPMDCGVPTATRFAAEPKVAPAARPLVTASLLSPGSARAGTAIGYTVRIASLSRGTLALLPCPSFQARLLGSDVNARISGSLGCTAKFLPAGGTLTVRERFAVPAGARGTVKLIWTSPAFGGIAAGAPVSITG
jgi:hypothetical protein